MTITVATAPCCWGVDNIAIPNLPDWTQVLAEATIAGYRGLELGPYGYMPLDADLLSKELERAGLYIVAGTIFDDLVAPENVDNLLRQTRNICSLLTQLPKPPCSAEQRFCAPYLVVIDWGHSRRDFAAGHPDRAPRLTSSQWEGMVANISTIGQVARDEFGIRATIHPHAGGYLEFEDEIDRILADISDELCGLCIDTGHVFYSKMGPLETLEKYWERVDYIHFKDIDAAKYRDILDRRIRFFDACAEGVMTPIGDGVIDYQAIHNYLIEQGYTGFITVEQERDPRSAGGALADIKRSRDYLRSVGFGLVKASENVA